MALSDQINQLHHGPIKVVAFDIGGVLIKINRRWEDALRDAGIRNNVHSGLEEAAPVRPFQKGDITEEDYLREMKDFLQVKSAMEALRVHNLILRESYPGTLELIEELNDSGLMTACLSNTNAPHWKEMLSGRFPNIEALRMHAVSHLLRCEKPEQAIYKAFEDLTGCMAGEIIFFDDNEDNVEAAREQGWRAFWIDHSLDTAEQMELILISEQAVTPP